MKEEKNEGLELEITEDTYKGKFRKLDEEGNIAVEAKFKILRVAEENSFCIEFIKYEENVDGIFLDIFNEIQNYLDIKLGYAEES